MAKQRDKAPRIKDIAIRSGVSIGTVDRVLHNRGDVSERSRKSVEKAMAELDYKPNIYASALAQNRIEHRVAYLMPHHAEGSYWSEIESGIREAAADFSNLNLSLEPFYFDQYNADSFVDSTQKVLGCGVNAVMFPPIFREESVAFVDKLNLLALPFTLFDSLIDVENMVAFFGQNALLSGRLAFRLLQLHVEPGSDVVLFHSYREGDRWSTQSSSRRAGFDEALLESGANTLHIESVDLPMSSEVEAQRRVVAVMRERPNVKAMVIFNSRSYLIADALKRASIRCVAVIGFDALERNVEALKEGYISALIGQQPKLQGYRSLKSLCDSVILNQRVEQRNYMPLDVLIAENIDDYRSFTFK